MGDSQKRTAILAVASRLFAEKGYGNTTTAEIAHAAAVAEGTLYHHFSSKDGIFLTIFDELADDYLAGVERLVRDDLTGAETLSGLVRFHFEYITRHSDRVLVILRDFPIHITTGAAGRGAESRRRFSRMTSLLAEILSRGAEDGSLSLPFSAREGAEMIRGILYGVTRHRMLGIVDTPLPRLARMVETLLLLALAPAPGGRARRPTEVPR